MISERLWGQIIVNVAKGIEEGTLMTLSEIIEQEIPQADVAVMSGPSHAEEVGRRIPTTIVVGAKRKPTAEFISNCFMNEVFRVFISPDVLGIELGGIGDLIVTCASMHSRNRRAGILIGQGKTMDEAMAEVKMVVEGVYSAKAAMSLSEKYGIQLPIIEQVNKVLFENKPADEAVKDLMLRDKKIEVADVPWGDSEE